MRTTGTTPCSVHELDFLYCRYDAEYCAVFEFSDGSRCRVKLCPDHFAQLWSIAEFVADRRDTEIVNVSANPLPARRKSTPRSRAKRAGTGR